MRLHNVTLCGFLLSRNYFLGQNSHKKSCVWSYTARTGSTTSVDACYQVELKLSNIFTHYPRRHLQGGVFRTQGYALRAVRNVMKYNLG